MNGNPFNVNYFDAIHCCMKYSASLTLVKLHEPFFDLTKFIYLLYVLPCCVRKSNARVMLALIFGENFAAWGLALVWVVLSCKWGLAKPIDKFLSFRWLLPLSRLTYCAYLVHPVTQIAMSLELKGTIHIHHSLVLTIFLGNTMISYSIALLLSLLFEAPFVRMLKVIFDRK